MKFLCVVVCLHLARPSFVLVVIARTRHSHDFLPASSSLAGISNPQFSHLAFATLLCPPRECDERLKYNENLLAHFHGSYVAIANQCGDFLSR